MNEEIICDWCNQDRILIAGIVEHMDHDEFAFCSKKCADLFFKEMSQMRDAAAEARED